MGTPKTRKMRERVCAKCGKTETIRADNASSICRSCATRIQNAENKVGKRNYQHGKTGTTEWYNWRGLFHRKYGGGKIKVCKRWRKYKNFLADMGERPEGHQIHRVDKHKGYTPDNCVWMDRAEHNKLHKDDQRC